MKNNFRCYAGNALLVLLMLLSSVSVAQISAIYSGGTIYREEYAIDELRNSGFTTVIIWTIHISGNGDLGFNGEFDLVRDGVYVGDETYPDFPSDVLLLKTAPTSINRVEFGLSSAGSGTFNSVEDFYNSEGFGPGTTLYENFSALRDAIPGIDAFNNDDEVTYDTESAVAFTRMLADLGFQNAIVPYTNSNFWSSLVSQVNATHPGNIDRNYLQCYAGGSGNSPCSSTWDFGIPVIPGLWGEGSSNGTSSPSEVENQMNSWQNQCGITGGFMWLYGDFDNSPQVAAYAAAINDALAPDGPPSAATNPNPSNGSNNASVNTTLSWSEGTNATSHDVYFGTDASPDNSEFQGNQSTASFNPGTLATNTTYYWRVDEVNSSGTATGNVWSFTTEAVATSNLAPDATITVSSEFTDSNWSKEKLTDGIIGINGTGEWASNGEVTPWAQLDWDQGVTTSRVVLYDRPTSIESISSGTLTFSNGSSVSVGALPDDGSALEVNFSERTITWVRFQIDAGEGPNNGMSEFEVYGNYDDGDPQPQPPVAEFSASVTTVIEGGSVSFADLSTNNPTSWSWTFSGGSPASSSSQNPNVTYNTAGTYDVSLTVSNADGSDSETKSGYITVNTSTSGPSLPTFYTDCNYGGDSFSLDVGSYNRQALNQVDGFSDNTVSSLRVPVGYSVTVYQNGQQTGSSGTFTADDDCLDDDGLDEMISAILVEGGSTGGAPVADFFANVTSVTEGETINFTDASSNNPTSWSWTFSGGSPASSTSQNPTVTYNTAGTYDVTLTSTNTDGSDTETKSGYITVTTSGGGGASLPTFYVDCEYGGGSFSLDVGSYNRQALNSVSGFVNNAVSSIEVPVGYTVTIYDRNLTGTSATFTADDNCLSDDGVDNLLSSVEVTSTGARVANETESLLEEQLNSEAGQGLAIYPNPFKDVVKINLPIDSEYKMFSIIDLSGRELMRREITSDELTIDLTSFAQRSILLLKLKGPLGSDLYKLISE